MIRTNLLFLVVLSLLLALTGCGGSDTPESLIKEQISVYEEIGDTLAKIEDEKSAKSNMKKIKKLQEKINDIAERANAIEAPSEDEIKQLKDKYKEQIGKAEANFVSGLIRAVGMVGEGSSALEGLDELEGSKGPKWLNL